ncbi:MAG: hypothetical protein F6K31_29895, partial [Symploca sp. SIO2G7]|nr:hypothetical protein [Symploca sp. SIO2G7]
SGFQGIDWRNGYAIFELDAAHIQRLVDAGWAVQTDPIRQSALEQWRSMARAAKLPDDSGSIPGFSCYRTVDQTSADMQTLAEAFPDLAEIRDLGPTWQKQQGNPAGDTIKALVIANRASPHPQAPFVLMAAQHARELSTAEIAARFAEYLLQNQAADADLRWLLDHREIHIIPQQNPDGRRQVENMATFWRKNQNTTACTTGALPGIDLNRNSAFFWGNPGSSNEPCSEIYRGPVPSSEPETQAIQNYLETVFERQRPATDMTALAPDDAQGLFISIHSFSELVLLPWEGLVGGNENNAPNHEALTILGRKFGFFTDYAVARWQLLPPAGGTTVDYAYGEFGVAAYTFEVGTSFQQPCDSFESTVWPANLQALIYAARAARRPYQTPSGPEIVQLNVSFDGQTIDISGQAVDHQFFRGPVSEPPAEDPVAEIVEVVVSLGVPPYLAEQTHTLAIAKPAVQVDFSGRWDPETLSAANDLLFAVAVDAEGAVGVPTATDLGNAVFSDGFELDLIPSTN